MKSLFYVTRVYEVTLGTPLLYGSEVLRFDRKPLPNVWYENIVYKTNN